MEELKDIIPLLQSMGISPDQITPEKLIMLQRLSKAFSDPNNLDEESISKLMKQAGLDTNDTPNVPKKTGKKTGRNEKCPCNSGKKFKKCCGGIAYV